MDTIAEVAKIIARDERLTEEQQAALTELFAAAYTQLADGQLPTANLLTSDAERA